ncbi:MAG: hypothetical protein ACLP5H_34045 [Desulfomonilaceae bacterium]
MELNNLKTRIADLDPVLHGALKLALQDYCARVESGSSGNLETKPCDKKSSKESEDPVSDADLPPNVDDWPQGWKEKFYTWSGMLMEEFPQEEADRRAEKTIREEYRKQQGKPFE